MVHTRETRAAAAEIKFLIPPAMAPRVREWARAHLAPDPHGSGPHRDEYDTSTLYFDTDAFDVYHRRGSYGRAKYRVRRYGQSDVVFLERKLRQPGLLIKRRTIVGLEALDVLERRAGDSRGAWGGEWFRRRLAARRLAPVCQVSYRRVARMADGPHGPLRLTLDGSLAVAPIADIAFAGTPGVRFLPEAMILELKYRAGLPALFRGLVEEFALRPASASKYRLGMTALGSVPAEAGRPAATSPDASYA